MTLIRKLIPRRSALRGVLGGGAVTVGMPLLDCFLNGNGTALASGAPLPVRFGTWFWGCGLIPGRWEPKQIGANYQISEQLQALAPYKQSLNIISGTKVSLDGNILNPHQTGQRACVAADVTRQAMAPSIDTLISDAIGTNSRFRSLEVAATGSPAHSISRRSATVINPSEISPAALYARVFGPDFRDPNASDFKPDPKVMVRQSVLTAIKEPRDTLAKRLGASDKARLEEYFTSLRQIEHQVELQLQKPAPLEACAIPKSPESGQIGTEVTLAVANHKLMAQILAHALACDQTRVVNISFTDGASSLHRAGDTVTHHIVTHEEPLDEKLGIQVKAAWFNQQVIESFAVYLNALSSIKEGDGTLLDQSLIFGMSECGYAKQHTLEDMPMLLAGRAGGRVKSGMHVPAKGDPVTRVGLTIQQVFGLAINSWGTGSMQTTRTITEIMA